MRRQFGFPDGTDFDGILAVALKAAGLGNEENLVPVPSGVNRVWLGGTVVVRINHGRFPMSFRHESEVLRILPGTVPHSRVLGYGSYDAGEWLVVTRLPGQPLTEVAGDAGSRDIARVGRQLGHFLRVMHGTDVPSDFGCHWLDDALAHSPWNAYHPRPADAAPLLAAARNIPGVDSGVLDEVDALLADRLALFENDQLVLVHSDIHPANVLCDKKGVTGLVDFESSRRAAPDLELHHLLRLRSWPHWYADDRWHALTSLASGVIESYPELVEHPHAAERLGVYEVLWNVVQLFHFPAGHDPDPGAELRHLLMSGATLGDDLL